MDNVPFGRELQQTISNVENEKAQGFKPHLPRDRTNEKETLANIIGLMGSMTIEVILSDINKMLESNKRENLDGYIFALSRLLRHDLAWQCIVEAFSDHNEPVPFKYYPQFGKNKSDDKRARGIRVS